MCVAVATCVAVAATAAPARADLVDTVKTTKPRAALSEFLEDKAKAAAKKREDLRAIVLYQALVVARGQASAEARELAKFWTLSAQNDEAAKVWDQFAEVTSDAKAKSDALAEAKRLRAVRDPFGKNIVLPVLAVEAKEAFKRGRAAFGKKDYGDALIFFHMGYALAPDLPGFLRELGATYEKLAARDKKIDFYRAYLLRRPFGKNADDVRKELAKDKGTLAFLTIETSMPCEQVWVNRQPVPGKLPQKKLIVAPGRYRAFCLSNKYEFGSFQNVTVAAGAEGSIKFTWGVLVNKLESPFGRIAIEKWDEPGVLMDLGLSTPELGVELDPGGRALKMVVKDDSGSRVEERSVRIRPGERFVVKW